MKLITVSILFLLLVSCGGGEKNTSTTPLPLKQVTNNGINNFDDNIEINQSVELFLYYPQTQLSNIEWTQTSGETVTFLTPHDKGIAFTPTSSGNYAFQVTFTKSNGTSETLNHQIEVANTTSKISARLGHVVSEGNKVSLRATLASNLTKNTVNWQQTSGPTVTFTDNNIVNKTAIFFNAPNVEQDTLLTFEANTTNNGITYRDAVGVLIENKSNISSNALFEKRVSDTFPYHPNSPYQSNLVNCVYSNNITRNNICTLNTLPLIAHDTLSPSVNDIMDRVIVSHQWMGDRFKKFLEQYDTHNDIKNMLRATTAIVISYDIRPSFYWGATGAIYLDANNFWLTANERDTLNEAPDFRAGFGNELKFNIPWRYVRNNDYLSTYITKETRRSREVDDGVYNVIGLMYHELAHANDFFPKSSWFNLNKNSKIIDAIPQTIQSDMLTQIHPLNGAEMRNLAQVSFHGTTATSTQKSYTPQDITQFFSTESAPQYYNYSSIREDYAMLFDGFMMKARYNIDRDVAITNQVNSGGSSSDYIVNWGQRGRVGDTNIKPRVSFVVERILPEFTGYQAAIDILPAPIAMQAGQTWIENLDISPSPVSKSLAKAQVSALTKTNNIHRPINEFSLLFTEKKLPKK